MVRKLIDNEETGRSGNRLAPEALQEPPFPPSPPGRRARDGGTQESTIAMIENGVAFERMTYYDGRYIEDGHF